MKKNANMSFLRDYNESGIGLESLWEAELWQEELVLDGLEEDCFLYSQNLMKNLGKKEGELEGFKDLLSKAESALTESEAAVEVSF